MEQAQQQDDTNNKPSATGEDLEQVDYSASPDGKNTKEDEEMNEQGCLSTGKGRCLCAMILLVIVVIVIVVPVVLTVGKKEQPAPQQASGGGPVTPDAATTTRTVAPGSTFATIQERGYLKCGVRDNFAGRSKINTLTGVREGFNADLCRVVAAAVFDGDANKLEFVIVNAVTRFPTLVSGEVDVLSSSDTLTMQRDVAEPSTGVGVTFSKPYIYGGLVFAGVPPYVDCANNLTVTSACQGITVCAVEATTFVSLVQRLLPEAQLTLVPELSNCYQTLGRSTHVLAGDDFEMSEVLVRAGGYSGPYTVGDSFYSKEPLALVTREDDALWSDFVNWVVLQTFFEAEQQGFSRGNSQFGSLENAFGSQVPNQDNLLNVIVDAFGSYGELYDRFIQPIIARQPVNDINIPGAGSSSGLLYAMPLGDVQTDGSGPNENGTMAAIASRGRIRCGVKREPHFADLEGDSWSGFNVDFCRALAAALFAGDATKLDIVALSREEELAAALRSDIVDVLAANTIASFSNDVHDLASGTVGMSFSPPTFYAGLSTGGIAPFDECVNTMFMDPSSTADASCQGLSLCVVGDKTNYDQSATEISNFPDKDTVEEAAAALQSGECNAIAGSPVNVAAGNIEAAGYAGGSYSAGSERFSNLPFALATLETDRQWSDFVYWVVTATIYAEELGITQETSDQMPPANTFGTDYMHFMKHAVGTVGSYAGIYERNFGTVVSRASRNLANRNPLGPLHYALPGLPLSSG